MGRWVILSVVQAQFDTCLTFVIQVMGRFPRRIVAHKAFPDTATTHLLTWILSSNVALVLIHRIILCDDVSMAIIDP